MVSVPQLGQRGGGWVVLQFALMPVVIAAGLAGPPWPDAVARTLSVLGAVLAVAGAAVVLLAARALGKSLTPYPRPSHRGSFVGEGVYRAVRHPTYSGGLLFLGGLSLAFSPWALGATAVLGLVWALKASVEERFLLAHYPGYSDYRALTRYRLIPFVY